MLNYVHIALITYVCDFKTFDLNALLKLDQDSTAELSKASCADESALHNTIRSQEGREHEGNYM